ncbi:unnamed protein product [Rhizophagus irregularis]|nr:unnamed protein product [Rhizophagus irregularis]
MRIAISKGYKKLKLYYSKTDNSHMYTIATNSTINDNINETNEIEDDFFKDVFGDDINKINRNEIKEYLQQPVVPMKTDPLQWWKVNL